LICFSKQGGVLMKQSICIGLLAMTAAVAILYPSPISAGQKARREAALLKAMFDGTATIDEVVARTATKCKCAPGRQEGLAAGVALPSVEVGSASGLPGGQVTFAVSLSTAGASVAGVQADIAFDSINTPVAATATGTPDCVVNPSIGKEATAFGFQPPGCVGAACTAFRALVLSFSNVDPIPDGSVLYTCNVDIAAGAAPGSYPLTISNVGMSTPDGEAIDSTGTDGEIIVSGGGPTPTPTPVPSGGPTNKDQCKKGGWQNFTSPRPFKNQGDCIQFVNTGR
jgi:hypothetical protein